MVGVAYMSTLLNWLTFGTFVAVLARASGRRVALPRLIVDTLKVRKPAGHDADASDSDSDDSDDSGGYESPGGALMVGPAPTRHVVGGDPKPGLAERVTQRIERWAGEPEVVQETVPTGPSDREVQRAALIAHLQRERGRPGLSAVSIVRAAAGQDGVPWGRVSESTVWRVWGDLK